MVELVSRIYITVKRIFSQTFKPQLKLSAEISGNRGLISMLMSSKKYQIFTKLFQKIRSEKRHNGKCMSIFEHAFFTLLWLE